MKDVIKVGQVWTSIFDKSEITVLYLTNKSVVYVSSKYNNESIMMFENFNFNFTLKRPEPTFKKLVLWNDKYSNIIDVEDLEQGISGNWIKKEIIVKDGSLYVVDEVV